MPSAKLQALRKRRPGKNAVAKAVRAKRVRAATARRGPASETRGVVAYHSTKGVNDYDLPIC